MKRIFSMKDWDILTRNMPLAIAAIFVLLVSLALPPEHILRMIFTFCGWWGIYSLAAITIEASDPQKFPGIWQRMPNWGSIMLICFIAGITILKLGSIIINYALIKPE